MPRELFSEKRMEGVGKRLQGSEVLKILDQMREGDKEDLTEGEEAEINTMKEVIGLRVIDRAKDRLGM